MTLLISFLIAVLALILALVSPFALAAVCMFCAFWGLAYSIVYCFRGDK